MTREGFADTLTARFDRPRAVPGESCGFPRCPHPCPQVWGGRHLIVTRLPQRSLNPSTRGPGRSPRRGGRRPRTDGHRRTSATWWSLPGGSGRTRAAWSQRGCSACGATSHPCCRPARPRPAAGVLTPSSDVASPGPGAVVPEGTRSARPRTGPRGRCRGGRGEDESQGRVERTCGRPWTAPTCCLIRSALEPPVRATEKEGSEDPPLSVDGPGGSTGAGRDVHRGPRARADGCEAPSSARPTAAGPAPEETATSAARPVA